MTLGSEAITVEPWPMEKPLLWIVGIFSFFVWFALAITIFGIVYIGLIGIILFVGHVVFIAHVKGSGVKLGPDQFPDLHDAVGRLARRMGFETSPDAYIVQAGGLLNAMATKLFRSNVIILYSDLLEACGENNAARDMIIAHELGHIKEGHLKYLWFLLPGLFVPFLGSALSRAREYTCDRYGLAGAGQKEGAMRGLTILAAGAKRGPQVNLAAMARQVEDLNSGWLTLGTWLATHPPLSARMIALEEALKPAGYDGSRGLLRALGIVGAVYVLPAFLVIVVYSVIVVKALDRQKAMQQFPSAPMYDGAPDYPRDFKPSDE
jgi:Zn-dependent protease with chaperone function